MRTLQLLLLVPMLLVAACSSNQSCDSMTYLDDGVCRVRADAAISMDAAPDAGPTFGTVCRDGVNHSDCKGDVVNACFVSPGGTQGFCSAVGCDAQPSLCPMGWTCFDLGTIQPGALWGCVKF